MEENSNSSARTRFIRRILVVDVALLIVAGLVSLVLNFSFGIILLALGTLIGVIGAFLGGPDLNDPNNPMYKFKYWRRPVEKATDEISFYFKHSVPVYAFENVMALAGLIAIIVSIPFVAQIMFSK
jgi:membrane protein required for beta-lactamase induction